MPRARPTRDPGLRSAEGRRVAAAHLRARVASWRLRSPGISFGTGVRFYDAAPMIDAGGEISLGDFAVVYSRPVQTQLTAEPGARLIISRLSGLNWGVDIHAARSIEIGENSMIGPLVSIHDTNFHPIGEGDKTKTEPIKIGSNVWLGRGVTVLPGVEIGDFSVVGAGSVVSRDVPPRTLVAGNPARVVREISASEGWSRRGDHN